MSDARTGTAAPGLAASLRRLAATAVEVLQVRIELVLVDLTQDKVRLVDALVLLALGAMALVVGALLVCALLIALAPPGQRLWVLGALTAAWLAGGGALIWLGRRGLRQPSAFAEGTLAELRRDREALQSNDDEATP